MKAVRMSAAAMALAVMTVWSMSGADEAAPSVMSTAMRSSDLDRSIKFYTQGLGMTVLAKRDAGAVTEVMFSFDGQNGQPGLMVFQDKGDRKATPVEHGNGAVKVILDVPDVAAIAAKLTTAGYPAGEIHEAGPYKILNAQDPDGYRYEIVQKPGHVQPAAAATSAAPSATPVSQAYGDIPVPPQPDAIPLLKPNTTAAPEQWQLAGKDNRSVRNISNPTLTPVLPDPDKASGAAVVVAPGGAFFMLSIDNEGFGPARWLADHGVAAFVLKYRTEVTPRDRNEFYAVMGARMKDAMTSQKLVDTPTAAVDDAKAAVRLIRERAAQWHVDPAKVGFLGFSAGAMTALSVGLQPDKASRPDFIAPLYPPMVARDVPADAPPMFLGIALDDGLFAKDKDLDLINSWRSAHRPLEVHLYSRGGHGFGMNTRYAGASQWPQELYAWMQDQGFVKPQPH